MTPLPSNPQAVILVDGNGNIAAVASNIALEFKVAVIRDPQLYADLAANKPFNTILPVQPEQVMSSAASKAKTTTSVKANLPVGCLTNDGHLVTRYNDLAPADQGLR